MSLPAERALIKRHVKRVCSRCRHQLICRKAHCRHMKIRYMDRKRKGRSKTNFNTTRSDIDNMNMDLINSSSFGWTIREKSGSKGVNENIREISTLDDNDDDGYEYLNGGNVYDGDDEHEEESDEDEKEDDDEDGFNVMQILRNDFTFRAKAHRITGASVFICKTCDMCFPTYHAQLVHVNNHTDSSSTTIDGENIMGTNSEVTIDDYDAITFEDDEADN